MAIHHLLTPEFCDCQSEGVLESLSSYTNAILTVTWGKGLPLSWSRSWFLQSCCVDNFRLQMLPVGINVLTWGDPKRVRARGRFLGSNLPFFLGHRFSSNWPLKRSIDSLRRLEYVGILKAQFPGTIKCIILLCFIHLKNEVGKYSLGSEGHQTQRGIKCCIGILDLNWLLLLSKWKD